MNKSKSITFTGVSNESQYESITVTATQCGCTYATSDYLTKIKVSGTDAQLAKFEKAYNS